MFSRLLGKALPPMDCEELAWYAQQDAALQMRIRMLACFVADLHGTDRSRELPGACRGARRDRATFEEIVVAWWRRALAPPVVFRTARRSRRSPGKLRRSGCHTLPAPGRASLCGTWRPASRAARAASAWTHCQARRQLGCNAWSHAEKTTGSRALPQTPRAFLTSTCVPHHAQGFTSLRPPPLLTVESMQILFFSGQVAALRD